MGGDCLEERAMRGVLLVLCVLAVPASADVCDRALERMAANDRAYDRIMVRLETVMERHHRDRDDIEGSASSYEEAVNVLFDYSQDLSHTISELRQIIVDMHQSRVDRRTIYTSDVRSCMESLS